MATTGEFLKNRAASSRRAATTLRQLADSTEVELADRGVMLAAAAVVERLASQTAKRSKERLAAEAKYERDHKAAVTEATKLLDGLPLTTTLEKFATVAMIKHRLPYLSEELDKDNDADRLLRSLNYWANDTRRDLAHFIASDSIRGKTAIDAEFAKTGSPD